MRTLAFFALIVLGASLCLAGFCYAIFDWIRDFNTGIYQQEHFEAVYETLAIVAYGYLGIRFMKSRVNMF